MRGVGRGEVGGGRGGVAWERKQLIATHVPLSPCLSFRCVSGGGSMKKFRTYWCSTPPFSETVINERRDNLEKGFQN
jgi:hypothetical protein